MLERSIAVALAYIGLAAGMAGAQEPPPAPPPSVDPALHARIVTTAGGTDALRALRGMRGRGHVLPLVDGPTGTISFVLDLRGGLREETRTAGVARKRWLSGRLAWEGTGGAKLASPAATAEIRHRFHELAAPFELARAVPDSIESAGTSPEGWTRLILRTGDARVRCDVDSATGHVRRVAVEPDPGESRVVEIELDDYRTVGVLAWPFRATWIVDGRAVRETIWDRVERADDLEAQEFLPRSSQSGL
jgi:hypothetical protein